MDRLIFIFLISMKREMLYRLNYRNSLIIFWHRLEVKGEKLEDQGSGKQWNCCRGAEMEESVIRSTHIIQCALSEMNCDYAVDLRRFCCGKLFKK